MDAAHAGGATHTAHPGAGANDHHAQLHAAAHNTGQADSLAALYALLTGAAFTGLVDISMAEGSTFLRVLGGGGSGRHSLVTDSPLTEVAYGASNNIKIRLQHTALDVPVEGSNTTKYNLVSRRNAPLIVKTADEVVNNSITLQNDDHIMLAVEANKMYKFELALEVESSAVAVAQWQHQKPA